jgi:2-polyprenyl-6-methoxyphenol hydroxylase-like FAD-dependent oxidoreductase
METTEVIICGCGPTGAMLAAQLCRLGLRSICIKKEDGITTDPRGIALDEDGIRALQSTGIYDKIYNDIGQCVGMTSFLSGEHNNLNHPPFLQMDYSTSEGGTGHVGLFCHKQPQMEKYLRTTFLESPFCQLRENCTLTSISEDDDWVNATYQAQDGTKSQIKGKFFVGADGKTGFTRKKYLESRGIAMEQVSR